MKAKFANVQNSVYSLLLAGVLIMSASFLGYGFKAAGFQEANVVFLYIVAVLLISRFTSGYAYGLLASVGCAFAFNFFFTSPYFTFAIDNPNYIITLFFMTITSLITSAITSSAKHNEEAAQHKEAETRALYSLNSKVSDAHDIHEIAEASAMIISDIMGCSAACLCLDEQGEWEDEYVQLLDGCELVHRVTELRERQILNRQMDQLKQTHIRGEEFYEWPIMGQDTLLGVLRIPFIRAEHFNSNEEKLLRSMSESIALAIDRIYSTRQRIRSQEQVAQERYRSNLLRAISHDLRTPLAGIMGTSEMIMDMSEPTEPRYDLARGIYDNTQWLHALVENILSLTRLQEGRMEINKELEPVEEVIGSAVSFVSQRTTGKPIQVYIPKEVLMVPMDAKLIKQVLVNLLDNALKHSLEKIDIQISVSRVDQEAIFIVQDHGEGIQAQDLSLLFEMFYTKAGQRADAAKGIGLGLTICKAIIEAHGGTIKVENQTKGTGAIFTFALPMEE